MDVMTGADTVNRAKLINKYGCIGFCLRQLLHIEPNIIPVVAVIQSNRNCVLDRSTHMNCRGELWTDTH